jgi:hypothetical protein
MNKTNERIKNKILVSMGAMALLGAYLGYKSLYWAAKHLDPLKSNKTEALKAKMTKVMDRLGLKNLNLNEYEEVIASEVVFPEDIESSFQGETWTYIYLFFLIQLDRYWRTRNCYYPFERNSDASFVSF